MRLLILAALFAALALYLRRREPEPRADFREWIEPEWDVTYWPSVRVEGTEEPPPMRQRGTAGNKPPPPPPPDKG